MKNKIYITLLIAVSCLGFIFNNKKDDNKYLTLTPIDFLVEKLSLKVPVSKHKVEYINNVVEDILDASVAVYASNSDGMGIGTGLVVVNSRGTFVWTNYHVVRDATEIMVGNRKDTWSEEVFGETQLIVFSQQEDIALLRIIDGEENFKKSVRFYNDDKLPKVGSPVYLAGHMRNIPRSVDTLTKGIISRYIDVLSKDIFSGEESRIYGPFIEHDARMYYGASGGGLYLEDGRCIGMNSRIWGRGHLDEHGQPSAVPVLGYAIPYYQIINWAKLVEVEYALFPD